MNLFNKHQEIIASEQVNYESLLPLNYTFEYQDLPFECELEKNTDDDTIVMRLSAGLGVLPYSSENITKRTELLNNLGQLIARGQVSINHHCAISMSLYTVLQNNFDAKTLIEAIVYTLLDVRETLDHVKNCVKQPNSQVFQN